MSDNKAKPETKYLFSHEDDSKLVGNAFLNVGKTLFGDKAFYYNSNVFNGMLEKFNENVAEVNVYPYDTDVLSPKEGGKTLFSDGMVQLILRGKKNLPQSKKNMPDNLAHHEMSHVLCHLSSKDEKVIKHDNFEKQNYMGEILETKRVDNKDSYCSYGLMYNETMMDIIAAIGINNYAPNLSITNNMTTDQLLTKPINANSHISAYDKFNAITRMSIAAFSNVTDPNFSYQDVINKGGSIFLTETQMGDGQKYPINDFLYGIAFDPMHIEREYDKYMGKGEHKKNLEALDKYFENNIRNNKSITPEQMKAQMMALSCFFNVRMEDYENTGRITREDRLHAVSNYNKTFNSILDEFDIQWTEEDQKLLVEGVKWQITENAKIKEQNNQLNR